MDNRYVERLEHADRRARRRGQHLPAAPPCRRQREPRAEELPDRGELRAALAPHARAFSYEALEYYWLAEYRARVKRWSLAVQQSRASCARSQALLVPRAVRGGAAIELGIAEAEEPHDTFVENALAKARHASRAARLPALADDSGPCVDALGGEPGVHSAYYAGRDGSREERDRAQQRKAACDADGRASARTTAASWSSCATRTTRARSIAEGIWHGEIARAPRGANGFGYDPLFLLPGLGKTAAELDPREKNRISHRAPGAAPRCWSCSMTTDRRLSAPARCSSRSLPPLALYVHIPWCVRKCPYCDFNSHERDGRAARARIRRRAGRRPGGAAAVGLGPARDQRLHRRRHAEPVLARVDRRAARRRARAPAARARTPRSRSRPTPARSRRGRFRGFRAAGVNRISIGVQSFDDAHARGARPHPRRGEARAAVDAALASVRQRQPRPDVRRCPAQTLDEARADIAAGARAAARRTCRPTTSRSSPTRCSSAGRRALPDDDVSADMQLDRSKRARRAPASSTTRPRPSRGPAIAAGTTSTTGSSATTSASAPARTASSAFPIASCARCASSSPRDYLKRALDAREESDRRSPRELPFEFMLNALRLIDGFPLALFQRAHRACRSSASQRAARRGGAKGLIERDCAARAADRARAPLPQRAAGSFPFPAEVQVANRVSESLARATRTSWSAARRIRGSAVSSSGSAPNTAFDVLRVVRPVGRRVQDAAGRELARHQRGEFRLHQAALVMALLRPRIGEEEMHRRERSSLDHVLQHLDRVVAHDAQVFELSALDPVEQAADARPVHFHGDEIHFRLRRRDGRGGLAHARADLEHQRAPARTDIGSRRTAMP